VFELSRAKVDQVDAQGRGSNAQLRKAAEVVQRVRPDVLLVNEIDFDGGATARLFQERYLAVGQRGQRGIAFPHLFTAPVNTGVPSGVDLDNNGRTADPEDAFGCGRYPGQYGMALYSRARAIRCECWWTVPIPPATTASCSWTWAFLRAEPFRESPPGARPSRPHPLTENYRCSYALYR
jgi:hypothetical protein